jgi:hypothetical protein
MNCSASQAGWLNIASWQLSMDSTVSTPPIAAQYSRWRRGDTTRRGE